MIAPPPLRERFPTLRHTLHFASHTLGAMPGEVADALADYARTWSARGVRAWDEGWMEVPRAAAAALERLVRAAPGSISLHPNATLAQATALSTVDFVPGRDRIVCTEEDFPSELYLFGALARRGATLTRVPARPGRRIEVADVVAAIDERTAVVAVSHVMFRTAQLLDLQPIVERARAVGAWTLVDAYQSVGIVDVDVRALDVDFMAGGSIKWLCGGPGTGWLYVRPELQGRLSPALTGWMAHEEPFQFDAGPQRLDGGSRRFLNGTPALPAFCAARPGFEIVASIGGPTLRAWSVHLTQRMLALASEYGLAVGSPREPGERGGTVCLAVPDAEQVCRTLLAQDVLLDHRPGVGLRLAPHFYTLEAEVDEVMRRVRDVVAGR